MNREVSEFVRRCVSDDASPEAHERFSQLEPIALMNWLHSPTRAAEVRVVVTTMNVFRDRKLRHYDLKRRLLSCLLALGPALQQ
jgi:hypothetical protein